LACLPVCGTEKILKPVCGTKRNFNFQISFTPQQFIFSNLVCVFLLQEYFIDQYQTKKL
jgi:hypothetical protein